MSDRKKLDLMQRCIEKIKEAEDTICCPVCLEVDENVVLCNAGHHVCVKCKSKIGDTCPTCRSKFTNTKSFLIEEVATKISNLSVSFTDLHEIQQLEVMCNGRKKEEYRLFIKSLLARLSSVLYKISDMLAALSKSTKNLSMNSDESDITLQLQSLTCQLNNLTVHMDDAKVTLCSLKQ